ncbi:VOC family protein [Sodalis sp.]|uniref:VOC family protein n=1 Tax=Sodalis sp. (in: enterobacteria) TaxID=1898979 RepID=UPI00387308FF
MHDIAIIDSDYARSKHFCCHVLGFMLICEHYRAARDSWKEDLVLRGDYLIELFSFLSALRRLSRPEAQGLCHLVFSVADIYRAISSLEADGVAFEPLRVDVLISKEFTFFTAPDRLPLELYEA